MEEYIENTENEEIEEDTGSSSYSLTYEDIYNAVYNGYLDAYQEIQIRQAEELADTLSEEEIEETDESKEEKEEIEEKSLEDIVYKVTVENLPDTQEVEVKNIDDAKSTDNTSVSGAVEFASGTDARLYTVSAVGEVSTADEQTALYTLDTRNILLIFLLVWFAMYIIKLVRGVFIKYTKGKGSSV